jgi:molybdenum cofactor synthesis domain-containing protein
MGSRQTAAGAEATAAILVIGDEILTGKADDQNARFLIAELRALGVSLRRVLVVPDDADEIATAVRELSARFDHVFTSGGVGPTHDDVTIEGIARGFSRRVVRNPELERLLRSYFGEQLNPRNLRMADVPEGTELLAADHASWPVAAVGNVIVLPGIPEIFRRKFLSIRERFRRSPFHLRTLYALGDEGALAGHLDRIDADFPDVAVGSYPKLDAPDYRVKITLESKDADAVEQALRALLGRPPAELVVRTE